MQILRPVRSLVFSWGVYGQDLIFGCFFLGCSKGKKVEGKILDILKSSPAIETGVSVKFSERYMTEID